MRRKASGKPIEAEEPEEQKRHVIDLLDALRNSVKGRRSAGGAKKRRGAKKATRRRKAA